MGYENVLFRHGGFTVAACAVAIGSLTPPSGEAGDQRLLRAVLRTIHSAVLARLSHWSDAMEEARASPQRAWHQFPWPSSLWWASQTYACLYSPGPWVAFQHRSESTAQLHGGHRCLPFRGWSCSLEFWWAHVEGWAGATRRSFLTSSLSWRSNSLDRMASQCGSTRITCRRLVLLRWHERHPVSRSWWVISWATSWRRRHTGSEPADDGVSSYWNVLALSRERLWTLCARVPGRGVCLPKGVTTCTPQSPAPANRASCDLRSAGSCGCIYCSCGRHNLCSADSYVK